MRCTNLTLRSTRPLPTERAKRAAEIALTQAWESAWTRVRDALLTPLEIRNGTIPPIDAQAQVFAGLLFQINPALFDNIRRDPYEPDKAQFGAEAALRLPQDNTLLFSLHRTRRNTYVITVAHREPGGRLIPVANASMRSGDSARPWLLWFVRDAPTTEGASRLPTDGKLTSRRLAGWTCEQYNLGLRAQ